MQEKYIHIHTYSTHMHTLTQNPHSYMIKKNKNID